MSDKTTMEGSWWIHGRDAAPQVGILSVESGDLSLKVTIPVNMTVSEVMQNVAPSGRPTVPTVIHGRDEQDKPVTLFGCFCHSHSTSQGQQQYEIDSLAGVQGIEVDSWQQPVARSVSIKLEHFHRWLGAKCLEAIQAQDGKRTWSIPVHNDLVYPITDGVNLHITQSTRTSDSWDEHKFTPDCQLWLIFDSPRSLEEITGQWVPWITRFFSLLVGTSVKCQEITFSALDRFSSDNSMDAALAWFASIGIVLGRYSTSHRVRISNPYSHNMMAPFSSVQNQLEVMLQRWHHVSERLEPVVDLFAAIVFHHSLYANAEFLFLIQALEVYHARSPQFESNQLPSDEHRSRVQAVVSAAPQELQEWLQRKIQSSNYKHLNERILEVFRAHETEAARLFDDIEVMAGRIAYTRNYLTHYNNDQSSPRFLDQNEVARVNFALEHFLWIILLREIGIQGAPIEQALRWPATATFTNLQQVG